MLKILFLILLISSVEVFAAPSFEHAEIIVLVDGNRLKSLSRTENLYRLEGEGVQLSWLSGGSTEFLLEVESETKRMEFNTDKPSKLIQDFYLISSANLRVKGLKPKETKWSDVAKLQVKLARPVLESQPEVVSAKDIFSYRLRWLPKDESYFFELETGALAGKTIESPQKMVESLQSKTIRGSSYLLPYKSKNVEFWRIRSMDRKGLPLSDWSPWTRLPVELIEKKQFARELLFPQKKNMFWIGGGVNYLGYSQTVEALQSNLRFQSIRPSMAHIQFERFFTPQLKASFSWADFRGTGEAKSEIQLRSPNFKWTTTGFNVQWHGKQMRSFGKDLSMREYYYLEYQAHELPYLNKEGLEFSFSSRPVKKILIGAGVKVAPISEGVLELYFGYAHLLATEARFSMQKNLGLEGAVSYMRRWGENYQFGLGWYGHYDQSQFKDAQLSDNLVRETSIFSKLEFRGGISF